MQDIKLTSRKQYLFDCLGSIKAKKTYPDQNILQVLLLCLNRNDSQTFKSSSCKKNLYPVYIIDSTGFNEFFSWICINWKTLFLAKVCCYLEFLSTAILLLSLKRVFWKKFVFYIFYLHSGGSRKHSGQEDCQPPNIFCRCVLFFEEPFKCPFWKK